MRCKSTDITIVDIKFIARLTTNRNPHCIPTWYIADREREKGRVKREMGGGSVYCSGASSVGRRYEDKGKKCKRYIRRWQDKQT